MKRLLSLLLFASAVAFAGTGDDKFLAAREAFRVGDPVRLAAMSQSLHGHELAPWGEYWQLSLQLRQRPVIANDHDIEDFIRRNSGNYLAQKLATDWLGSLGRRGDWPEFLARFPLLQEADQEIACYAWQAHLVLGSGQTVLEDAHRLWLAAAELPPSCTQLMNRLANEKRLTTTDVWARVRNMLELSKYDDAYAAARYLPDQQLPNKRTLERIAAKPERHLDKMAADRPQSRSARETSIFAVLRLARKDTAGAAMRWRSIEAHFDAEQRGHVWARLARQAALQHMNEAPAWYGLAGELRLSEEQHAWRVRAALRSEDWPEVLKAIDEMPPGMAQRPDWVYWRARALAATGRDDEALALYRSICAQPGFYGLLAAEELGLPLSLPPAAAPLSAAELAQASEHPGLRRALALFRLDMRVEAVREWNWSVRAMNDRELLAAAELARRNDLFDRAIFTAEKTQTEHDYSLRYLAPYRDAISPKTQALALEDSWVYGLMRQESRFVSSAKSGVGARGLMQVMPSTAKLVARKIGLSGYRPAHVDDMDTNLTLGTNYLKMVLQSLDNHPMLACTAYNAGPSRAQRWRANRPLEGAIYAETIPFTETRDYVKKVMANSVYYSALFDEKPQTLKSRLGIVQPRVSLSDIGPGAMR